MEDHIVVAHGFQKTEKIICGKEGKNVVTYGRLPSPASSLPTAVLWDPINFDLGPAHKYFLKNYFFTYFGET